jgi:hypothetical protein
MFGMCEQGSSSPTGEKMMTSDDSRGAMSEAQVLGVVGVFIAPNGRVVADYADFEQSGYGGFTLLEAQRIRCRRGLAREVIERFAGEPLAKAVDQYRAEEIVGNMVEKQGYQKHFIVIGHEEAGDE